MKPLGYYEGAENVPTEALTTEQAFALIALLINNFIKENKYPAKYMNPPAWVWRSWHDLTENPEATIKWASQYLEALHDDDK